MSAVEVMSVRTELSQMEEKMVVRADGATLNAGDKPLALLPGMTASVEIRTGQRTVPGFVPRPMFKTQAAFRPR